MHVSRQNAILMKLSMLRQEVSDLTAAGNPPLGPPDFMRRYINDLNRQIAVLEVELQKQRSAGGPGRCR